MGLSNFAQGPVHLIVAFCWFLQDYFKMQPEGYGTEDVYVCESRYAARTKSFKKIKIWAMPVSSVKLVSRDVPLPVVRVASMFAKPDQDKLTISYTDGSFVDKVRGHPEIK